MNYIKNYQKINLQRNQDFLLFLKSLQNDSHKIARKTFLMEHFKKMPLEDKIRIAIARIEEFIEKCKESNKTPVISFSGGKDSCVLRHLVQKVDPTIKCETATELFHPEIAKFLKTIPDTTIYKSTLSFNEVIKSYGYPILSKEVAQRINNVRTSKTLGK
jgi:3'-phosphoadenosine 5'-phosphosulfate sulfotransferase (PAPS reductase)/FAD synthetase